MPEIFFCPIYSRKGHSGRKVRIEAQFYYYIEDTGILFTFGESLGVNY